MKQSDLVEMLCFLSWDLGRGCDSPFLRDTDQLLNIFVLIPYLSACLIKYCKKKSIVVKFEVFIAVQIHIEVFWLLMLCSVVV
jgi:hypothetical protein